MKFDTLLGLKHRALGRGWARVGLVPLLASMLVVLSACQTTSGRGDGKTSLQDMTLAQQTLLSAGQEAEFDHKYDVAANAYGRLFEKRVNDPKVLESFVRTMRYAGKSREIVNYVEKNTPNFLNSPDVQFEYGKSLIAAGQKTKALVVFQDVSKNIVENWQVFSAMGITYDALANFPRAIEMYTEALRLSPDNVIVLNNFAMSQAMNGQLGAAIATLEKAAVLDRNNAHIRQNLALLYAVHGEVNKAKSLASMDLNAGDLETNLSFYRRFGGTLK